METYFLGANVDQNFLQFMVHPKQFSDEILDETVQAEPKKVQLIAEIEKKDLF